MPVTRSASSRRGASQYQHQPPPVVAALLGDAPTVTVPAPSDPVDKEPPAADAAQATTTEVSTGTTVETQREKSTSRRSTTLRLAQAEEEIARAKAEAAELRAKLAEARLRRLELENEDDDQDEVATQSDRNTMVRDWIDKSASQFGLAAKSQCIDERLPTQTQERKIATPPPQQVPTSGRAPLPDQEERSNNQISALATAITEATRRSSRYQTELPIFDGSSSEWLHFRAAYIESLQFFTTTETIARMRKALRGEAKEATSCLFLSNTDPAEIMKLLEIRFGRPDSILLNEIEKIKKLPKLGDDSKELCVFASKINNLVASVRALRMEHYMYNPDIVRCIVGKMDRALRYRWFDYANANITREPDLIKMAHFLLREADNCSRFAPLEAVKTEKKEAASNARRKPQRTLTVEAYASSKRSCPVCDEKHWVDECSKFKQLETESKWKIARESKACYRCLRYRQRDHRCKYKPCGINGCKSSHHSWLHFTAPEKTEERKEKTEDRKEIVSSAQSIEPSHAYLKIVPVTLKGPKASCDTHALLDEGSTITLVDTHIASLIGASGPLRPLSIEGVAGTHIEASRSKLIDIEIEGRYRRKAHRIVAHTIDNLSLSPQTVTRASLAHYRHLEDVRNEITLEHAHPTMIIGQDNWHLIVSRAIKSGLRDQPVASLTELGWVLHGVDKNRRQQVQFLNHVTTSNIDEVIQRHFELDNIGIVPRRPHSDLEQRALDILEETCKRTPTGRFEVGLLWRDKQREVPESRDNAVKRLQNMEKKLDKDQNLKEAYEKQMQHLIDSGYAEVADQSPKNTTWYLPHFAVINKSKPKPRIVHDAAAKSKGVSLNDLLLPGPDLLQSLPGVLMRFRQLPVAVSADIKEMFLQIRIREEDRDALRFLWRGNDRVNPPTEHRMTSVIFGASSSPCTAIFVKNRNARDFEESSPEAATAIVRTHYMDDYLQSFENIERAASIATQVDVIHKQAHFELRGWTSNEKAAVDHLTQHASTNDVKLDKESEKVLGLRWRPTNDTLGFNVNIKAEKHTPTKREALRIAMSIFDPLGLVTPVNIQAKHLLQESWRLGIGWDEPLPPQLENTWRAWLQEIDNLGKLHLPRAHQNLARARDLQLHTFTDASQSAYAVACYWRVVDEEGRVSVSLIAAKGRVAPLKIVSVPRLELQAAVLGARLAQHIIEEHDVTPAKRLFWTDSRTVLAWLQNGSRSYKPYVAHRLAAIEELTKVNEWRWTPTSSNVADDATREIPKNFNEDHRWFHGPKFLRSAEDEWPQIPTKLEDTSGEERVHTSTARCTFTLIEALPSIDRFSSWLRLIRATARVLQFIDLCRHRPVCATVRHKRNKKLEDDENWKKVKKSSQPAQGVQNKRKIDSPKRLHLEGEYVYRAEQLWIKAKQEESFSIEKLALIDCNAVPRDSRLRQMSLMLDTDGIIRLKTRIAAAKDISEEQRAPAVMDGRHPYTRLYIEWQHRKLHHGGVEIVTNQVRQRFWVLRLRTTVRNVIKNCIACRKRRAAPPEPPTSDLPSARVAHHEKPFTYTGLDYFGPLSVTVGRRHEKRYVALFTCLTSRAVHLEIAVTLSTDSAIMALRRMMARRGCPSEIWSDNGTNFKGADTELRRAALEATKEAAADYAIRWRFIPPGAPFMGGAWERMVRSVKTALEATLFERHPPEEILHTLLVEAEHTINSRPLTHVSVSPEDLTALTPNDLLLGGPSRVPIPGAFVEGDTIGRRYWRHAQHLADVFWSRWVKEALPLLQNRREPRGRGHNFNIGDVVIVVDSNLPRNTWPLGVIEQLYPGPDGVVRTVDVRTKTGTLRRPAKKLVWLQSNTEPTDEV